MKKFDEMIEKIAEELNIKITLLSDNWTIVLEKDNKIRYITGYQFDLNSHGIGNIMDDKGLFYDLLRYKGIPVIEQYVIFSDYNKSKVLEYFSSHDNEIIVKGNISNAGREVFKVNDKSNLFKIIDQLLLKQYSVSLCPYYHIKNEYRVIILDNKVRNIFGKIKPFVIGDGEKTVLELAKEYSNYYVEHEKNIEKPNYIPQKNEKVELSFKFNLSSGAKTFTDIEESLRKKIIDLALETTNKLNITFASVDIIYTEKGELFVLEANSGVTMNNYILQNQNGEIVAYNIYRDAINLMFK